MLATGNSAVAAVEEIKQFNPRLERGLNNCFLYLLHEP
jgi:uracil phosphoribosyltransferase